MKRKMIVICASIAALHLVIGGAVMLGGCTGVQEDEPMPSNARIQPKQEDQQQEKPEVQDPPVQEPEKAPETVEPPKVEDPVVIDEPVVEKPVAKPVEKPVEKPVVKTPAKGDKAPVDKKVPVRSSDIEYIVQKNDTYWGIAQKFGVSMKELETYNAIPAKKLRPGQKILIPATGKKVTKPAAKRASVKVRKSYEPIPANGIYIVQKNDSYSKIASRFGLRAADIAEYNNLPLNKHIQPNQKLKLPPRRKSSAKPANKKVPTAKQPAAKPVKQDAAPVVNDELSELKAPVIN